MPHGERKPPRSPSGEPVRRARRPTLLHHAQQLERQKQAHRAANARQVDDRRQRDATSLVLDSRRARQRPQRELERKRKVAIRAAPAPPAASARSHRRPPPESSGTPPAPRRPHNGSTVTCAAVHPHRKRVAEILPRRGVNEPRYANRPAYHHSCSSSSWNRCGKMTNASPCPTSTGTAGLSSRRSRSCPWRYPGPRAESNALPPQPRMLPRNRRFLSTTPFSGARPMPSAGPSKQILSAGGPGSTMFVFTTRAVVGPGPPNHLPGHFRQPGAPVATVGNAAACQFHSGISERRAVIRIISAARAAVPAGLPAAS